MTNEDDNPWKGFQARQLDDISEEAFKISETARDPNFAILVLAIGQWVSRPDFREWSGPSWALEACQKYFAQSIHGTRKVSTPLAGSPGQPDDGQALDLVARLLIDPDARIEFECSDGGTRLSENLALRVSISVTRGIPREQVQQREINRLAYHWKIDGDRRLSAACEAYGRKLMASKPLLPS